MRRPVRPPTPGEVLGNYIREHPDLTQKGLAARMKFPAHRVRNIVRGRAQVTAAVALRLSKALNTSVQFWLNVQREVDLFDAERKDRRVLRSIRGI